MNIFEFARSISHLFFEMVLVMIQGAKVAAEHPVHGQCCNGEISAIIIRPGEKNRYELKTLVEVKEERGNAVHILDPKDLRVGGIKNE